MYRRTLIGVLAAAIWICFSGAAFASDKDAQRAVIIGAELTEIAYALGVQDRIVAVDQHSNYPAAAQAKANLGYFRRLSAEGVLSVEPDLVIAVAAAGPPDVFDVLRDADIPLIVMPEVTSPQQVEDTIIKMGEAFDVSAKAAALATDYRSDLETAQSEPSSGAPVKALFVMAIRDGAAIAAGRTTVPDTLFAAAGASNAATFDGFKPTSPEAMTEMAPNVIYIMKERAEAAGGVEAIAQLPGISATPAAQNGRIITEDSTLLLRLGLRTPDMLRRLSEQFEKPVR